MYSKSTILFLLLFPIVAMAEGREEHRIRFTKEFNINPGGKLEVNNKYGKIVLNVWDRKDCKAEIEIVGFGRSGEQAKKLAESVEVNQSGNDGAIRLETKYNPSGSGSWFGGGGKKDSKEYVNVNYVINVPRNLGIVMLKNQFGDVLARELPFKTSDISVNYGFLDIGSADNLLRLNINYTDKARVGNAERLQVNANYSNLRCDNVDNLLINSNNGNYVIGKASEMKVNCNYDDYKVNTVEEITIVANYTEMKTEKLEERGVFKVNYTDVSITKLLSDFKDLNISGRYSSFKIGLEKNAQFKVTANLRYGDLNTKGFAWKDVNTVKKDQNLSFSAITTNATHNVGSITIDGAYTDVKLGGD